MVKLTIGDIVQIPTARGFAYAQFTHQHPMYGAVLRVFKGVHRDGAPPSTRWTENDVQFTCLFPLRSAISKGRLSIFARATVPQALKEFPTFRSGTPHRDTGKVADWWLWDGKTETRVGQLSQSQFSMPIRGVWNDTLLVNRIENEWSLAHDWNNSDFLVEDI